MAGIKVKVSHGVSWFALGGFSKETAEFLTKYFNDESTIKTLGILHVAGVIDLDDVVRTLKEKMKEQLFN